MSWNIWGIIAAFLGLVTFLSVVPFLFGMVELTAGMSMENSNPAVLEQIIRLFVGAVYTLVPPSIGGAILFALGQLAEARA